MNAQLTHESIIVHFQHRILNVNLFADVITMHNGNMRHARAIEFDYTNLLATVCFNTSLRMLVNFKDQSWVGRPKTLAHAPNLMGTLQTGST